MMALLCQSPSYAETAAATDATASVDGSAPSGEIIVTGARADQSVLPDRPQTSVNGIAASVLDTPRSLTEISASQLLSQPIRTTDDLVKFAPGITRGGGQNASPSPFIRGLASEVYQDGQRVYVDGNDHPFNLNAYEGADVVEGPSSVVFGPSNSTGGYINYITKKPYFDGQHTEIRSELGTLVPGDHSYSDFNLTVDNGGPITSNLAYRISIKGQRGGTYYDNVKNNYNSFYGALSWKPASNVHVDWNGAYDNYYNWNITRGWNRYTQATVDDYGSYYAGRATPIISSPNVGLWSPVFASGAANSAVIGWQTRTSIGNGQYQPGAIQTTSLPSSTIANAGTILGWVYDPTLAGNGLTKISGSTGSGRPADKDTAKRYTSQLKIGIDLSTKWNVLISNYIQRSINTNDSVGAFIYQNHSTLVDQRIELRGDTPFTLFGANLDLKSNTGASFRHLKYRALSANSSFNFDPYDLTQDAATQTPASLYGLPTTPGSSGSWIGTPGVPQQSSYFGYLNLNPMYPVNDGYYAEKGGFPPNNGGAVYTSAGHIDDYSIFTQQQLKIGDHAGINAGGSLTNVRAKIYNPLVITPADNISDSGSYWLPSYQVSVFVKPTDNTNIYFTYDRSQALNTGVFGNFLVWGPGNKLSSDAFHSVSELYEIGAKADLIPNKLFVSAAGFIQYRDLSPDPNGNIARIRIKGLEGTARYQPDAHISAGFNVTVLDPVLSYTSPFGFSLNGFYADNLTAWGDSGALNPFPGGKYKQAGIPKTSITGFAGYTFSNGLGAQLSGWWTSGWYTDLNHNVRVPAEYDLDLSIFYHRPRYDLGIRLQNITNQKNFANELTGAGFLEPLAPFSLQGTIAVRF